MALQHRLADLSYRIYDRARHKTAFSAAEQAGTAPDFSGLHGQKYAVLVTFRKDGSAVPTPVWFALLDDRRFVMSTEERTAKVRRIGRDPHVRVFPSDARGKALGPAVEGTARILTDEAELRAADAALDEHYGRTRRVYERLMADAAGTAYIEVVPAASTEAT